MTAIMHYMPEGRVTQWIGFRAYLTSFRIIARALSSVIYFHNTKNRPKNDGFCVANHTSPIDLAILSCDNVYAFVSPIKTWFKCGNYMRCLLIDEPNFTRNYFLLHLISQNR